MNFDFLDDALWKPIGKGLSEADTFMRREMPLGMSWGAPAAALGAYFAAPAIGSYFGGSGAAGGLTEGLTQGGAIAVDPTVAGYGEGLAGLGFDTAAEQAAIANSGGLFSSGADLSGLAADGFTQGGSIYVDPTVAGYGENLGGLGFDTAAEQQAMMNSGGLFSSGADTGFYSLPTDSTTIYNPMGAGYGENLQGLGFDTAAEQQAIMDSGGAFSSAGSSPSFSSLNEYLKEAGIDTGKLSSKAFELKDKGFDYGKMLAQALKGMGGEKKKAAPQQYVMQQLQRQKQAQQAAQNDVNQLAMPIIPTQGIVQEPNMALAQQLRRNRY